MINIFQPPPNQRISFSSHVLLWVKSGHGLIEVDFKTYSDFDDRLIFLAPGQYIKFMAGTFEVARLDFPGDLAMKCRDYRVLFKHLISLGYVDFTEHRQQILSTLFGQNLAHVLDISTNQWFWQNPFNAEKEEYALIFDLKDVIDKHFNENWSVEQFLTTINHEYFTIHKLLKNRIGLTIKDLAQNKLLLESQKEIALTDKPIKEVAFDMGYKDPSYFTRFFKRNAQVTPQEFREHFGNPAADTLVQDLLFLIHQFHKSHRSTSFYADRLHMSIKTLSRKVKHRLNQSVGDLIRSETIHTAKQLLQQLSIKETALELGFLEANHFSTYFKKYVGISPSEFQSKKYHH